VALIDVKNAIAADEEAPELTTGAQSDTDFQPICPRAYPQVIKYMGSKAAILDFIGSALGRLRPGQKPVVDLFAGAAAISGGFGHQSKIISNDIQEYSAVIASIYLLRAEHIGRYDITALAAEIANPILASLPRGLAYEQGMSLEQFNEVERQNRDLIYTEFAHSHHLFTRVYSGTWWSAEQCVWIDAIRQVLDRLYAAGNITKADFNFGLTCLMHAMAYTSQGTGHYAQYRDAKTDGGMADICKYRLASLTTLFNKKFRSLLTWNLANVIDHGHELISLDYRTCLSSIQSSVVYADPPYAFVHYSRFYHALETLVRYDYPEIQQIRGQIVKGRYRVERHQSPFCIKTQVRGAFSELFEGVRGSQSDMLLSYSNTGMIEIDQLMDLAVSTFGSAYRVSLENMDHTHMTMGRKEDRSRQVTESLIVATRAQ
jgi:adenine-specific DNA-methyltransferase